MRRKRNNAGFVLLIVLLVLVICGTILTATARRTAADALRAADAQRQLQLRWGTLSCRDAALTAAQDLLQAEPQAGQLPPAELRRAITLGGLTFHLIVADEQAKANANTLSARSDTELVRHLNDLQAGEAGALPVRLLPRPERLLADEEMPEIELFSRYSSFDQMFVFSHPSALIHPTDAEVAAARRRVTLWGSGSVNLRNAELPVLQAALGDVLSAAQIKAVDAFRRQTPDFGIAKAWKAVDLSDEQIEAVEPRVTVSSDCHSVWIVVEGKARNWYRLYVQQRLELQEGWTAEWATFLW